MPDIGADVPSSQAGADDALSIAEDLKGIADDFESICGEAETILSGEPSVDGMAEFQSEYQSYMNSVQSQAVDISDNIYSSAGEIGETDERNREGLAITSPTDPNALAF